MSEDVFLGDGPWMRVQTTCLGDQTGCGVSREDAQLWGALLPLGSVPAVPASLEDCQADVGHVWGHAKGHGHAAWHVWYVLWTLQCVPCMAHIIGPGTRQETCSRVMGRGCGP